MSPSPTKPPTAKQLTYLKALAERTATTFTYPATATQASREIDRLRQLTPLTADERAITRRAHDGDRERHTYATAPQPDEIVGYGSTASWR
jgi:hypothetical protein